MKNTVSISQEDLAKLCDMSQLVLDDKVSDVLVSLDSILTWMESLMTVDVEGVMPLITPVVHSMPMREDSVNDGSQVEQILFNASDSDNVFFNVPKIIG